MQIAAVLFDRLTALDVIGPYEVLQRLPDAGRVRRPPKGRGADRERLPRPDRRRHLRRGAPART